jgi:hypothetical protein
MKILKNLFQSLLLVMITWTGITVNAQTASAFQTLSPTNRVAILPLTYFGEGSELKMEEMRYRLQGMTHSFLREDALILTFQDPAETNALLYKNGITGYTLRNFSPQDLAALLNVEFVVFGTVSQESTGMHMVTNSTQVLSRRHYYRHPHHGSRRYARHNYSQTSSRERINTTVDVTVYNDRGYKVFSKSRRSILTTMDAYRNSLHYLLKRSPLYKK